MHCVERITHQKIHREAESSRRDTNMNMELVLYSTNKILVNASQSILAQYNNDAKYVLEMLK